jgi:hypothetical protein
LRPRYYSGDTKRPQPPSAYDIGWGLHNLGVEWCSGPVALAAAGHTGYFLRLLTCLAGEGRVGRESALRFAFATHMANAPITSANGKVFEESDFRTRTVRTLGIFVAARREGQRCMRSEVAIAALHRDLIDVAWEAADSSDQPRSTAKDFSRAYRVFRSLPDREDFRLALALAIIANYTLNGHNETETEIVRALIDDSPVRMLRRLLNTNTQY